MKLYLSSHLLGDHADHLVAMTGGPGARMAIITNALDFIPLEAQLEYTRTQFDPVSYFVEHGFDPMLLDLRFYFGRPAALREVLLRHQIIWALGGNAFLLRRAMRESAFDEMIYGLLSNGLVYAGWSAGACVAGTSLRPIGLMDNPDVTAPGYRSTETIWDGLGLLPFSIVPHHRSEHPEAGSAEKAVEWAVEHRVEHRALRDGDVFAAIDGEIRLLPRAN